MSYQEPPAGGPPPSGQPPQGQPQGQPLGQPPLSGQSASQPPSHPPLSGQPMYPPAYPAPPFPPQSPPYPPPYSAPYGAPPPMRRPFNSAPFDATIVALGFLALVFSHFAFYRIPSARPLGFNLDAYHGFLGWAGVWLVFLGAVAMAVPLLGRRIAFPLRPVALVAAALGLIFLIITIWVRPDFGFCDGAPMGCVNPVQVGATYWIDLVLAIAVVGLLGFTVARGERRTGGGAGQPVV